MISEETTTKVVPLDPAPKDRSSATKNPVPEKSMQEWQEYLKAVAMSAELPTDASDKLKEAIGDLVHNKVEELNLTSNNISDEGAKALAEALKVNTALQGLLWLGDNEISDEGAKALAEALKVNTALQKLDLYENKISDEGAKALAEALKVNTALQGLGLVSKFWLGSNKISDEGAKALAEALKVNTTLQRLCLSRNKIFTSEELNFNNISDKGVSSEIQSYLERNRLSKAISDVEHINVVE